MNTCIYCGSPVSPERVEIGRPYCMSDSCLQEHGRQWAQGYRLVLVPKQGFTYVTVDDPFLLTGGRSSGKQ